MAQKRKREDPQRQFICAWNDRHYFRAFESLINSDAFINLSPSAKVLYIYMGLESKGNNDFYFPFSKYQHILSKDGFKKAKRQLVESGFITEEVYRTSKTVYRLSDKWKYTQNT